MTTTPMLTADLLPHANDPPRASPSWRRPRQTENKSKTIHED